MKINHETIDLTFKLPHFRKEDIKVAIKNHTLFIKANKKHAEKKEKKGFFSEEHSEHSFNYTTTLPKVNAKQMRWFFKDGILTIKIPKL